MVIEKDIYGEEAMEQLGSLLAPALEKGGVIHLEGNLGMGKTTLVRGILRGLDYSGPVKSPTYTLVEPYEGKGLEVFHFDLYRVGDPEELEFMGVRDYFHDNSLCLIEWAEMGAGILPQEDIVIHLDLIRNGRKVVIMANSDHGRQVMANWSQTLSL